MPGAARASGNSGGATGRSSGWWSGAARRGQLGARVARSAIVDDDRGTAGGLDGLASGAAERVRVHGELLGERALGEDLDRDVLAAAQALGLQRVERDLVAGLEAPLEVLEVDRLRVRAEGLERHRLLHVRAAQLAHPHVDGHLPALEVRPALSAGARARALLAAAGRLAGARALAAADALARLARARRRLEGVQTDALGGLVSHRRPPRDGGRGAACPASARCP